MAQLPSAFACQASSPARSELPLVWMAKSMIIVVPPQAAARVPVSKVSADVVPAEWHLHVGVGVDAARQHVLARRVDHGVSRLAPRAPRSTRCPRPEPPPCRRRSSTSTAEAPSAVTTVPPAMTVRMISPPRAGCRCRAACHGRRPMCAAPRRSARDRDRGRRRSRRRRRPPLPRTGPGGRRSRTARRTRSCRAARRRRG